MKYATWILAGVVCLGAHPAFAQPPTSRFGITDNSFLIEEAFNQESGIFQHIFVASRTRSGDWSGSFTQEWPVKTQRHQFSFTVPYATEGGLGARGDLGLNYRFQLLGGEADRPAISPRLTVILPTSASRTLGREGVGWETNLPVSVSAGPIFVHLNAGARAMRELDPVSGARDWTHAAFGGGSLIVALTPMVNLMAETLVVSERGAGGRETSTTFAPGARIGWNVGDQQLVVGLAVPITRGAERDTAVLAYFSYELPFVKR